MVVRWMSQYKKDYITIQEDVEKLMEELESEILKIELDNIDIEINVRIKAISQK